MRVIAGEKRGTVLISPKDKEVRPTSDKIKGAIFNTIQMELNGAQVFVDFFAGSGAMGIEALSRGVERAYFCDVALASLAVIKKNLTKTAFNDRAEVLPMAAQAGVAYLAGQGVSADLIFMDPPYAQGEAVLSLAAACITEKIVNLGTIIMIEHEKSVIMPLMIENFTRYKEKRYGITVVSYYRREESNGDSSLSREL